VTWVVPLALGSLAIAVMAVFTVLSGRRRQAAQVAPAAVAGPRILIHDINDDRCTGCDACVAVCPTNVLDLVDNKSRVLRFQDCIQCEACMVACPTEALVMFPEGATPPPLKVPEIDEHFQTAVPGQYLIGEVAGKPLVKNAANLGRSVVEHMLGAGLRPGALAAAFGYSPHIVDVAIVGSGPGGLSAALSCTARGLSYVVLEKEQQIASTISRYPKGKLVMAEPYDTTNLSLLPVFDSSKEQLIPIWREVLERTGVQVHQGESVEAVTRQADGSFDVRTTIAAYRAQRVVLSIGTRGKPRTLQVPGENLPKVYSLLEDPDEWRGRAVLVIGGGDSACEAALALADAGAMVIISYRGKGFGRAAPKNKQAIEAYAAEGRIKAKLGSQVLGFDADSVTLALGDGSQKRYPNEAAFVLIGADPPIQWLERLGVRFVERDHQYQLGKTDDLVRRYVPRAIECPEDAARAAAQILGGAVGPPPTVAPPRQAASGDVPLTGPRKWLRSATSLFSSKSSVSVVSRVAPVPSLAPPEAPTARPPGLPGMPPPNPGTARPPRAPTAPPPLPQGAKAKAAKADRSRPRKLDAPMPLSEFAKRQKPGHTGHGRRDSLTAGERTRILRMLRDEGGRLADQDEEGDSQVYIGAAPPRPFDLDFEDAPAPAPRPAPPPAAPVANPGIPARPAVMVGLAQAQANAAARKKRDPAPPRPAPPAPAPPPATLPPPSRVAGPATPPPPSGAARAAPPATLPPPSRAARPPQFGDEPTRQVDDDLLAALRASGGAGKPSRPRPSFDDEATRAAPSFEDEATRFSATPAPARGVAVEDQRAEATRMADVKALERGRGPGAPSPKPAPGNEEPTRAVDLRKDKSMSEIDWDID
jgi:thioredoxin reductase/ferredoxin